MIDSFIQWCNNNEGFLAFILGLLTLLLTWKIGNNTIKAMRLPYEPKFVFDVAFEDYFTVIVTNLADFPIHIEKIVIKSKHRKTVAKRYLFNDIEHIRGLEPKMRESYIIPMSQNQQYSFPDGSKVRVAVTMSGKTIKRDIPFIGG